MAIQEVLPGRASPEATRQYARDHSAADGYYRIHQGLAVSSIGLGSYLGDVGPAENRAYEEAAFTALSNGVNVLDTAINYRHQQSERDLGRALARFGRRDQVVIATKGGFIPRDAQAGGDPRAYVRKEYMESGILRPNDIVGGSHCIAPEYLRDQIGRSLRNLGVEAVDVYFVHNPEAQLNSGLPRATFEERMRAAFEELERQADAGRLGVYGVATWDGLRVSGEAPNHVSLERLLQLAEEAHDAAGSAAPKHRFGAIELPVNVGMVEAATSSTQSWKGKEVPVLEAAHDAGLMVLASASLLQARLLGRLPPFVRQVLGAENDLEAALEFTRSCPGVTTALVGMGNPDHARSNVAAMTKRSPRARAVLQFFERTPETT